MFFVFLWHAKNLAESLTNIFLNANILADFLELIFDFLPLTFFLYLLS